MYVNYILGNCAQLITWMRCTLTDLMEWGLYLNTSLEWVSLCTREFSTGRISFKGIINLNAMHTDDRLDGVRLIYEHISGCSYMHQRTPTQPTYYVFKNTQLINGEDGMAISETFTYLLSSLPISLVSRTLLSSRYKYQSQRSPIFNKKLFSINYYGTCWPYCSVHILSQCWRNVITAQYQLSTSRAKALKQSLFLCIAGNGFPNNTSIKTNLLVLLRKVIPAQ